MTDSKDKLRLALKQEMKLALDAFKQKYKEVTKGIKKIYFNAIVSNDLKEVQKQHKKFFGHIKQSKFYKEKWE